MIDIRCLLLSLLLLVAAPKPALAQWSYDERSLAPFVPTPQEVVDKMLQVAAVKKDEMVYDLGCGDGRIIITAAQKFGARSTPVERAPNFGCPEIRRPLDGCRARSGSLQEDAGPHPRAE